jgi:integrase
MKTRQGSVKPNKNGTFTARVTFTDSEGGRHDIKKIVKNVTAGWEKCKELLREFDDHGATSLTTDIRTFADLAAEYEKTELVEPQYVNDKKINGLRSYKALKGTLAKPKDYFKNKPIKEITYRQLEQFRIKRFNTPIVLSDGTTRTRSVASVNRELALLRRMFKIAVQEGWMTKDPFTAGKSLISLSDEVVRKRILSFEEENRLMAWVSAEERCHLRPIVICALDTGMRRSEITSLRWWHVDLERRAIHITAMNTKTLRGRDVPISDRLAQELIEIRKANTERVFANERVFQAGNFKRSWATACRLAEIKDLHFHDLRATFATRLIAKGLANSLVAKILGHSSTAMTDRYTRTDDSIIQQAAELLNRKAN